MTPRTTVLVSSLAVLLAAAALWGYGYMASERAAAATARADVAECRQAAAEIQELGRRPALAADREKLAAEITGLVERAAQTAGIAPGGLSRISPELPRRIGDTVYKEKTTQVLLRKVTLQQFVALVHGLVSADPGLHVKSIRLTAPRTEDAGNTWAAELVLAHLIYDPLRPQ